MNKKNKKIKNSASASSQEIVIPLPVWIFHNKNWWVYSQMLGLLKFVRKFFMKDETLEQT